MLPAKKNYDEFVNSLIESLSKNFPEICFYLYGSYIEDRLAVGRSDIDGGIILNEDFVTDKERVLSLSKILSDSIPKNKVDFHINLLDLGSSKDGRFLSYPKDYTDYFKEKCHIKILSGPNFIPNMNGLNYKAGVLESTAYNFRKLRNNLLLAINDIENNPKTFIKNSRESFKKLSSLPKKLLWLLGEEIIPVREKAYARIKDMLETEFPILERSNDLLGKSEKFYKLTENTPQALTFYKENLTCFEKILKTYANRLPNPVNREVRG